VIGVREQMFVIEGRLDGMNTIIDTNRYHKMAGAKEKKQQQRICAEAIRACGVQPVKAYPVCIKINWIEPNARRDPDNIATGKKFIFDALQETGVLRNDSMKEIWRIEEGFGVDSDYPRIVVIIREVF
jgi:Holliday junction resolvase RusA-like endonuclease